MSKLVVLVVSPHLWQWITDAPKKNCKKTALNIFNSKWTFWLLFLLNTCILCVFFPEFSWKRKHSVFSKTEVHISSVCKKSQHWKEHFDAYLWRIWSVHFFVKKWRRHVSWENSWMEICLFSDWVAFPHWVFNVTTFPNFYLDMACKQLCCPPRKSYI